MAENNNNQASNQASSSQPAQPTPQQPAPAPNPGTTLAMDGSPFPKAPNPGLTLFTESFNGNLNTRQQGGDKDKK
ncbi:hypothetical protein [Desulfovibrio sp. 3_1_syn3]|uniref:hypothetical protein n=1 Tax=Desulfovibrio sp. 3_1_syn3 TaxID=457398 RepID=UPI0011C92958|nr:hypothetical protein [Desulfovibrio sp. 3_1_syn3]